MKIVIDISEDTYSRIKVGNYTTNPELGFAIQRGIVLPKGHGDLIDRNTVQISAEKFHSLGDLNTAQWVVDNAPTVISADK